MTVTELGARAESSATRDAASISSLGTSDSSTSCWVDSVTLTRRSTASNPGRETRRVCSPIGRGTTAGVNPFGAPSISTSAPGSSVLTVTVPVLRASSGSTEVVRRAATSTVSTASW